MQYNNSFVLHGSIVSTNSGTFESHSYLMEKQIAQNIRFELLPHKTSFHATKHNEETNAKNKYPHDYPMTDRHRLSLNSKPAYCATGKSSQWGSVWVFSDFCEIKVYKH